MRNGYVMKYHPNHHRADSTGMVYEHILQSEKMLGRKLFEKEVVHHEDHDRANNNFKNLYVFRTASDHTAFHAGGKRFKNKDGSWSCLSRKTILEKNGFNPHDTLLEKYDWLDEIETGYITKTCTNCEREFYYFIGDKTYCSTSCFNSKKSVQKPTKEKLYELLLVYTFTEVARKYGVSCNAVRKRCRKYNIPHTASYYRAV